jgi:hypothetical protein
VIICGRNFKDVFGDIYTYDLNSFKWDKVYESFPRIVPQAVIIGRFLMISGGLTQSGGDEIEIVNVDKWTIVKFKGFGGPPPCQLSKHSVICNIQKGIIFGGSDRQTLKSINSFWKFYFPILGQQPIQSVHLNLMKLNFPNLHLV